MSAEMLEHINLGLFKEFACGVCCHRSLVYLKAAVLVVLVCGQARWGWVCQAPAGLLQACGPQGVWARGGNPLFPGGGADRHP